MLDVRLDGRPGTEPALALPVLATPEGAPRLAADGGLPAAERAEIATFLAETEHSGAAGTVHLLPRPGRTPRLLLLAGVGTGDEAGWRSAGAALARRADRERSLAVALPPDVPVAAVRGVAEGLWLAAYRYRLTAAEPDGASRLSEVTLLVAQPPALTASLEWARTVAACVYLARDLTNTPSDRKTPDWFARQVVEAASDRPHLDVDVLDRGRLAAEGFGGVLAVGRGSSHEPRLVRLSWDPPAADSHVVLVGKGITFDTGGISIKPRDSMKLMRKDMGGAAAAVAATLGAAVLGLPVRVTALAPLAENAVGADAFRPGDVVHHHGGLTSEISNTDAEGRLVLADALAYAERALHPDVLVDLATLTGAQHVALGKRTAALFTEDDALAGALAEAAADAGERVWRMPLVDDYVDALRGDIADMVNAADVGGGAVTAALYLREFTGTARSRWAHLDMSAPAWSDSATGELVKGATGWGVRTLLRWLEVVAASATPGRGEQPFTDR